jgi:hypothetical protein
MSSDHGAAHAHDAHHEAFDPEPIQELGADEAPSPAWLPIAGASLLLVAATWFFYPGSGAKPAAAPTPVAPVTAAPAAAAPAPAAKPGSSATRMLEAAGKRRVPDLKAIGRPAPKPAAAP